MVDEVRDRTCYKVNLKHFDKHVRFTLPELACSGFISNGMYSLNLSTSVTHKFVGNVFGRKSWRRGDLRGYTVILLTDGTAIECVHHKTTNSEFVGIYLNGCQIGEIRFSEYRKFLGISWPIQWQLIHHGELFGTIDRTNSKTKRTKVVTVDGLPIQRPSGDTLSMRLGWNPPPSDFFYILFMICTLAFLYTTPRPNPDLVINKSDAQKLPKDEELFYFAVCLYFRAAYFQFSPK